MGKSKLVVTTAVALAGAVMLFGSVAFACTNLATLNLNKASGQPGDTLEVTGSSFRVAKEGPSNPVLLRWNGLEGPVLAQTLPDAAGNVSLTATIPQAQPGYYVLVATQHSPEGVAEYGTPARAAFQILGPGGRSVVAPSGAEGAGSVATEPASTGMIALTVALGVLGLALFAAGTGAFIRQARRREVPVAAPVRKSS